MTENTQPPLSLSALKAGDREEFARFVNAYSAPIYRLALKMTADPAEAEDVLQNTFLKALQNIASFEERSALSTWLYRIAANEALMTLRRRKPQISLDEEPEEDSAAPLPTQFSDWCCLPESEFASTETRQQLEKAIQQLPHTLKVVFLLRDIEGLSIKETSEALGLAETAVKTRLLRARLRLREQLSSYFGERLREVS